MLNCSVLLGLEWAEPIMFLSLHVTFSCIRTFIYPYIDIDIVGAFLHVSLSLSLSLSLLFLR